jgi:phage tail-like protein
MTVFGQPRNFHKKFKFIIDCDGFSDTGFQSCSELSHEIAVVVQWQGGVIIPDKSPGRVTYTDITLARGATMDKDLYMWAEEVADAAANSGRITPDYKRILDIVQQERDNTVLRRWRVFNAWPNKFVAGEWDNDSDENTIEQMVLTYDYYKLVQSG